MAQFKRSDRETVVTVRLPRELHDRLKGEAGERGFAAEIRRRLEASDPAPAGSNDPWFGDVLAAIGHAAAGATQLKQHPLLPRGTMDRDGKHRPYDVAKLGEDVTAYKAFMETVESLLWAFAPKGVVAVSAETEARLTGQLVALALGALGQRGIEAFGRLPGIDRDLMKHGGGGAARFGDRADQNGEDQP